MLRRAGDVSPTHFVDCVSWGMDVFWLLLEGWCNPSSVCCLSWMSIDLSSLSSPSLNCRSPHVSDESQLCSALPVLWSRSSTVTNQSTTCHYRTNIRAADMTCHHAISVFFFDIFITWISLRDQRQVFFLLARSNVLEYIKSQVLLYFYWSKIEYKYLIFIGVIFY